MPKRVDHDVRRRQITDAVCRITVRGGPGAATFREVAAEAGVSVRLVQYYFGTKDQLMLATQRHVAERATARSLAMVAAAEGARGELRTLLGSFIPTDDESRDTMVVFVALHTATLVDATLKRPEAWDVPAALHDAVRARLEAAGVRAGADPEMETSLLVATVPSLAQAVLDGGVTADHAFRVLDYALDRALA